MRRTVLRIAFHPFQVLALPLMLLHLWRVAEDVRVG
jgi:hypothetical protein